MAQLLDNLKQRFFDSNGDPLVGGKIYSYDAGTSTPRNTYTDYTAGTANANPTILDANGEASIWIDNSAYKFVVADADDNVLLTTDNVSDIANGSVITAKIADEAVTTDKIEDLAVTTAKINDLAVTTGKILNDAVTEDKIVDNAISTAKIQDGSITKAKLDDPVEVIGAGGGASATTSGTLVAPSSAITCTLTTTGRSVFVGLIDGNPDATFTTNPFISVSDTNATGGALVYGYISILRDGTPISIHRLAFSLSAITTGTPAISTPIGSIWHFDDSPSAGSHTYSIKFAVSSSNQITLGGSIKLIAFEIS